jgi:hypothetical protein
MDNQIIALSERVARLEKSNRAMKLVVAVAVLAMVATSSTPRLLAKTVKKMAALDAESVTAGTLTAQQINLVNGSGQTVAVLGTNGDSAGLVFVDNSGKWLMALGATQGTSNSSAGLVLFDGNDVLPGSGVPRAALGISSQGAAMVASNGAGNPALISGVSADGTSSGSFALDTNGYSRAGFGNASNGSGIYINDANNVTRYVAGVAPDGSTAGSVTYDATGKPQLELGGAGDGSQNGMVSLDSTGQDRLDAGYSESLDSGGVVVKDASGNVIWYAPPEGESGPFAIPGAD